MRLKGKVAFLTAAAGAGIGQTAARTFAREGARVVVTDAHRERAVLAAEAIKSEFGIDALGMACDVTSRDDVERAVNEIVSYL